MLFFLLKSQKFRIKKLILNIVFNQILKFLTLEKIPL
jgi:hypothetical protein